MSPPAPTPAHAVLLADAPSPPPAALQELGGISLLERLLRTLERAGVRDATVLSGTPEALTRSLAAGVRARPRLTLALRTPAEALARLQDEPQRSAPVLLVPAALVLDPRLCDALLRHAPPAALLDSNPPPHPPAALAGVPRCAGGYLVGPVLVPGAWLTAERLNDLGAATRQGVESGELATLDVAGLDPHVVALRRNLRPYWFPAPEPAERRAAEAVLLDAAQKGTLDLPAWIHAPIERFLVRRIWRSSLTPNQITLATTAVAWAATALFAGGQLVLGVAVALLVGVLDGVDGKLARAKVETSELGEWEHQLDWLYEFSWWGALAWHFRRAGELPGAFRWLALLLVADLLERAVRRAVKQSFGRDLDSIDAAGRAFRLLSGRRNVYVWTFAVALAVGEGARGYLLLCLWGAASAAFHLAHAAWLFVRRPRRPSPASA